MGAPSSGAIRTTTVHAATLEITAGNLGLSAEALTLRWFWLGRYESSKNWFRSGDGEKTVSLDPRKSQVVTVENTDVEANQTKGSSNYKSGGNLLGWVIVASNAKGETEAVRVSDSLYLGFATSPPPKQRKASSAGPRAED